MDVFTRWKNRYQKGLIEPLPGLFTEVNVHLKGNLNNLKIDGRVVIQSGSVLHLGGMKWCMDTGSITISDGTVISHNVVLFGCGPGGLTIGRNVDCGPGVGIFASRTDYSKGPGNHIFGSVEICNDVIIYANAVISPGVRIGEGAVIAAGAVVVSDIPANTMAAGLPARVIKKNVR